MNILLITRLYPAFENQSIRETTYALHFFSKVWMKEHHVQVLRPVSVPTRMEGLWRRGATRIDQVDVFNWPIYRIPRANIYLLDFFLRQITKRLEINPDVIISHLDYSLLVGDIISRRMNKPHICGLHATDVNNFQNGKNNKYFYDALDHCTAIACRSQSIHRFIEKLDEKWFRKSFVATSGIEEKWLISEEEYLQKALRWKRGGEIRFITVASLQKLKNIDVTIQVLSQIGDAFPWKYTIVGDGEEKKKLCSMIKEYHLGNRIEMIGQIDRSAAISNMRSSDIFIMVSAPETFGLAYLEAMASGNIIIGAKGFGIDGIVRNGENGFLCTPRKADELKKIILELMNETKEEQIVRIAKQARDTVKELTMEKAANHYLKMVIDCIKRENSSVVD